MIFVSTGGIRNKSGWESCNELMKESISHIELSGGCWSRDQFQKLLSLKEKGVVLQVHNYFPPPEIPFVLNLATDDEDNLIQSFNHVIGAMQWANSFERPIYSFHAGFLVNPKVSELGKPIQASRLMNRSEAMKRFLEQVNRLAETASRLGVKLLLENNVVSKANFEKFNNSPCLMADADECLYVMRNTPDNIRLLIDVAHLNVSATSLKFNKIDFLKRCSPWIDAYHLSDNDGLSDLNMPINKDSWFWPYLKKDLSYYSLEVYNVSACKLHAQQKLAESIIKA